METVQEKVSLFFLDQEVVFKWQKQVTPLENIQEAFKFILNEIKKAQEVPDIELRDENQKVLSVEDIVNNDQLQYCIAYLPEKPNLVTKINQQKERNITQEFDLSSDDKCMLTKYQQGKVKNNVEKVSYHIKVLKKQNEIFLKTDQVHLQNNADMFKNVQIQMPKIQINSQDIQQTDNQNQKTSPKFGEAEDDMQNPETRKKVGGGDGKSQAQFMKEQAQQKPATLRGITPEEIMTHNQQEDCWTVYQSKVYDVTNYLKYHPGGIGKLLLGAGKDCTALVAKYHSWVNVHYMLQKYQVGFLVLK